MYIIEKYPEVFFSNGHALFRIPQSSISASEGRAYPRLGFKMTKIIELVGTQAIFKLLSYYLFALLSKNFYATHNDSDYPK